MLWLLPTEDHNGVRHTHWVLYLIAALNIGVFVWMWNLETTALEQVFNDYALTPADGRPLQWLTSTFMHAGWMHLAGNMFFLWLFGDNIEDALGHLGFLLVYAVGGLAGTLAFVGSNPAQLTPTVGASGCVAAVAGVYAVLFAGRPVTMRVMLLVFPIARIYARAFWVLLFWFGLDVLQTIYLRGEMAEGGGVNFVVHAGGFAFGVVIGIVARMHGVLARYEQLDDGDFLFGYWPARLERLRRIRAATRPLPLPPAPATPTSDRGHRQRR